MPKFLDQVTLDALSDPGTDPKDPNLKKPPVQGTPARDPVDDPSFRTAVKDQPWLSPDDPNIPRIPDSDGPATSEDLFDLVHNGEKIQVSRDKGLKLMQQALDYDIKMKNLDAEATRRAEQRIGQLIAEGKLITPQAPGTEGQVEPQVTPTPRYPTTPPPGTIPPPGPAPYGYQPYPAPASGPTAAPQVDEFGFPVAPAQASQVPQVPQYQPSPEVDMLRNQMAQMQNTIESLTQIVDQNTVSSETQRLARLMREAQPKMPRMRAKEVLLEIAQMGNEAASRLDDLQILQMCKRSHDSHQSELDSYLAEYFEKKKREAQRSAPSSAYQGSGVPVPEKPLTNFDEARKAADELLSKL